MIDFEVVNQIKNELKTEYSLYFEDVKQVEVFSSEYDKLPNSVKSYAIEYAREKAIPLFKSGLSTEDTIEKYYTPEQIQAFTDFFISTCKQGNIIGFIDNYCNALDVSDVFFYSVINGNYSGSNEMLNITMLTNFKRVVNIPKLGVLNKLGDDRTGVVVLANNEKTVGLEYAQKRTLEKVAIDNLNTAQLPTFGSLKLLE